MAASGIIFDASPIFQSGYGPLYAPSGIDCRECGKSMGIGFHSSQSYVRVEYRPEIRFTFMASGSISDTYPHPYYRSYAVCPECAGYDVENDRFKTLADRLREAVPMLTDMPDPILADFLEEHGPAVAHYIRQNLQSSK